jgi:hypothetical protein
MRSMGRWFFRVDGKIFERSFFTPSLAFSPRSCQFRYWGESVSTHFWRFRFMGMVVFAGGLFGVSVFKPQGGPSLLPLPGGREWLRGSVGLPKG